MALESFTRRALLLKAETVEGVDAAPVGATDGLLVINGSSSIEADVIERAVDTPHWGAKPFLLSKRRGTIEGEIELIGASTPGTAAPIATALRMAGMAQTLDPTGPPAQASYNPISTGIISATAWFYHSGTLKKLTGCRADISGLRLAIGDFPKANISILGNFAGDVDEASLPVVDLSAFQTPVPGSTETMALTLNGFAVEGTEVSIDFASALAVVEHTEARLARITDRVPTFTVTFYRPAKADFDPYALWNTHAPVAIVATVDGGTAGKITRLTIGQGQIEGIEEIDIEGDFGYRITGRCVPTSAGNDEFLLDFE
jgi:hypothetical protein